MPKAKPMVLNPANRRKDEKESRREAELSFAPISFLPDVPARLRGHNYALAVYARLNKLYSEVVAEIVTAFDEDVLVDYCLASEEAVELKLMRDAALALWSKKTKSKKQDAGEMGYLVEKITALDSRLDLKRDKCQKLRESLYLTPRARAGAKPPTKPPAPEADEMERLLAEAEEAARVR